MVEKHARKKRLVDWDVQGTLLIRATFYLALCVLNTGLVLLGLQILLGPSGPFLSHFRFDLLWFNYSAAFFAALFTLPLILIDVRNISHRLVGANTRLRRSMRELAEGKEIDLIRFRDNDFWQGMADDFNAVAIYVEKVKRQAGIASTKKSDTEANEPVAVN